jgi:hypothetical protein
MKNASPLMLAVILSALGLMTGAHVLARYFGS